jgi:hypothetical protein
MDRLQKLCYNFLTSEGKIGVFTVASVCLSSCQHPPPSTTLLLMTNFHDTWSVRHVIMLNLVFVHFYSLVLNNINAAAVKSSE